MQKTTRLSVMILLICTAAFQSSFGISDSRNKQSIRMSNIINNIGNLSEDTKESSSEISEFSYKITEIGAKYVSKNVNFTIHYLLFTPTEPNEGYNLKMSEESVQNSTFNQSLDTKFLIHGFTVKLTNSSAFFAIKDELLQNGDFNVIVVNWTNYNGIPYTNASINAVFVGFEVGKLIQLLIDFKKITPQSVHIIGHSLGAQVASYAGKIIKNITRISGLDAAGPIFGDLPDSLRLTYKDAVFVDAIHTNGGATVLQGFGTLEPYGNMDFFPNGGSSQPHCSFGDTYLDTDNNSNTIITPTDINSCSHDRVLFLFLYSINTCRFDSVKCSSYLAFENGKCRQKTTAMSRMGFYATYFSTPPPFSMFYLNTPGASPYCTKS